MVGRLFEFGWNTIRKAVKDVIDCGLKHRDMSNVLVVAVGEISPRKGHIYHTRKAPHSLGRNWSGISGKID